MIATDKVMFTVDTLFTHVYNPGLIYPAIDKYLNIRMDGFEKRVDWEYYRQTGEQVVKTFFKRDILNVYNPMKQTFPTGRLGYLMEYCQENGIVCEVADRRERPKKQFDWEYIGPPADGSNGMPPRPYQVGATKVLNERGGRGILWHATASGKTETAAHIMVDLGVPVLYMVPSLELLDQTSKRLQECIKGVEIGILGDGVWNPQPITVCTAQTLWARYDRPECGEFLNSRDMFIVDECHHVQRKSAGKAKNKKGVVQKMNSWYIIALNCSAYYRVGLTGSPGKDIEQKRALLECAIGRVIDRVTTKELIDRGIVSDVQINIHKIKHTISHGAYPTARKDGVLLNEKFNEYIVHIAMAELKAGRNVLLVTGSKAHQGPLISRIFKRYDFEVPFVSGDDKRKNRSRIREDFRAGRLKCLIGTVYREGVDFPKCDCGILCDGGEDEKATIQFLGRLLRKAKGKGVAQLHDFQHKDKKYLKRHSNARINTYIEEELEKIVMHKGITV